MHCIACTCRFELQLATRQIYFPFLPEYTRIFRIPISFTKGTLTVCKRTFLKHSLISLAEYLNGRKSVLGTMPMLYISAKNLIFFVYKATFWFECSRWYFTIENYNFPSQLISIYEAIKIFIRDGLTLFLFTVSFPKFGRKARKWFLAPQKDKGNFVSKTLK